MKVKIANLGKGVKYLKYTNFTSLLDVADDLDAPETSKIPLTTTRDVHRVDESEVETDEDLIEIRDVSIYKDLPNLEEMIMQSVNQTSLSETFMGGGGSSGTGPS